MSAMPDVRKMCKVFLDFVYDNHILPEEIVNILEEKNRESYWDFRLVCKLLQYKEIYVSRANKPTDIEGKLELNARYLQSVNVWRDKTSCRYLNDLWLAANDFFHNVTTTDKVFVVALKELICNAQKDNTSEYIKRIEDITEEKKDDFLPVSTDPSYIGTYEDFIVLVNDLVKNKIPFLTKRHKGNKCQYCKKECQELDAAHLRGREREVLMKEVWDSLVQKTETANVFRINVNDFITKINHIHSDPKNFYFLCKDCHREYDKEGSSMPDRFDVETQDTVVSSRECVTAPKTPKKDSISKSEAIKLFREHNYNISSVSTFASLSNSTGSVYWANPSKDYLKKDWWLILNDTKRKECHLFYIPANTFKYGDYGCVPDGKTIGIRSDKENVLNIYVEYDSPSFKIKKYNVKLLPYKKLTISY